MASPKTSLSSTKPIPNEPAKGLDYSSVAEPPNISPLSASRKQICEVRSLTIKIPDGPGGAVPAILHLPQDYSCRKNEGRQKAAALLLSGAGCGVVGPSSMYLSIAEKLASLRAGIPIIRLDYRYPARNKYCVSDVQAAMGYMDNTYGVTRFVLVGWSFGGAPVFTAGGSDRRVIGCATVPSQTASTEGIHTLAPTPVLLLHGTGDKTFEPFLLAAIIQ